MFTDTELLNARPNLKRFAYSLTLRHQDAEDLLQDTLLRALNKRNLFETGSNITQWAMTIMYNIRINNIRVGKRDVLALASGTEYDIVNCGGSEVAAEVRVILSDLRGRIAKLSSEQREVLRLITFRGMNYEDTAKYLDIPLGTVRSRLSRARHILKDEPERRLRRGKNVL